MPIVYVGSKRFEADVIVFDKDGTLIDFHHMWGQRALKATDTLLQSVGYDPKLEQDLFLALGYDRVTEQTRIDGPLATIPHPKTSIVMATILYLYGLSWEQAESHVEESFTPVMAAEPTSDLVRPLGNTAKTMAALSQAGIRTVVATSDNRQPTLVTLEMLGVLEMIDVIFCGDDAHNPQKPSPEVLYQIADQCGADIGSIMMVGDTVSDLSMAKNARAAATVGVIGGANSKDELLRWSDVLINSIDEIRVEA